MKRNRIHIPQPPPPLAALVRVSQNIARRVLRQDGARPIIS